MIRITEEQFDAAFAIMEASFPTDEYRPYTEQKALFSREEYRMYGMVEAGEICAFAAVWELGEITFLEHLAVAETHRNRGLGAALLQDLAACANGTICLEVELPETDLSRRRIGFYERCGFSFNEYDYTQPPISKGKSPIPLRIMSHGGPLSEMGFHHVRDTLYRTVYGVK
ncbi:MAG: GNAT family N-acetyltransferase [Oscillospiraceae bacterium]|nr:GNAT family N-acetyltransferase [Oscillospiraceae bacterium]